ncbi:hypothetical protein ACJX0J_006540 [Zea mays]
MTSIMCQIILQRCTCHMSSSLDSKSLFAFGHVHVFIWGLYISVMFVMFSFLSSTLTICDGSNTIPSLPMNLDSDAEHSVHDINSLEKNAPPIHKPKKALSSRWDKIRADVTQILPTLNHVQMIVYMLTHLFANNCCVSFHLVVFKEQDMRMEITHSRMKTDNTFSRNYAISNLNSMWLIQNTVIEKRK